MLQVMKARIEDGVVLSPYPPCDIPQCSIYSVIKHFVGLSPDHSALVSILNFGPLQEVYVEDFMNC